MKSLCCVLLFLPCLALAQVDSVKLTIDTTLQNAQIKIDSLEQSFIRESDSIRETFSSNVLRLARTRQRYAQRIDSIRNLRPFVDNPIDTLTTTVDNNRYTNKLDSIDEQIAIVQLAAIARLDSLKRKTAQKINDLGLPKDAEGKISSLTLAMDKVNVTAFNTDIAAKSGLDIDSALPNLPGNLQGVNLPETNISDVNGINPELPRTGINTTNIKGNAPHGFGNVTELADQSGRVQQQVRNTAGSEEAVGKVLEGKAAEQVNGLPDKNLPGSPGLPGNLPKTGDDAKGQVIDLAKKEAINHFAGKEQVLTSAMEKMAKYKQKYNSVSSLKDIEKEKPHNEMYGKPLRERLVPALTLQFQNWQDLMLDINPSLGYKLSSHVVLGLGWNQRIAFNLPDGSFNRYSNIHGIRSYVEYNLKKGFGFRFDLESMNTPLKQRVIIDTPPDRVWVWSAMIGIKQKYSIYKKLNGNAQLMYNLFDKDHRSPYTERLNWRIGLEFTLKNRIRKTKQSVTQSSVKT